MTTLEIIRQRINPHLAASIAGNINYKKNSGVLKALVYF